MTRKLKYRQVKARSRNQLSNKNRAVNLLVVANKSFHLSKMKIRNKMSNLKHKMVKVQARSRP